MSLIQLLTAVPVCFTLLSGMAAFSADPIRPIQPKQVFTDTTKKDSLLYTPFKNLPIKTARNIPLSTNGLVINLSHIK